MRSIDNTPPAGRYLMVSHRLSERAWRAECDAVTEWLACKPESITEVERSEMLSTIRRPLRDTEHSLVIVHCYADVPENTTWDIVFDRKSIDRHEATIATLRFGIIWHRLVSRSLADGWHQVAVVDFPNGLPKLIESLPLDPETEQTDYVCLCAASDLAEIQLHRGGEEFRSGRSPK